MLTASPTFKPRPRRPRRCARSPAASPSRSLLSALLAPGCSRCPCWQAAPPTRSERRWGGGLDWPTPWPRASILRHDRVSHLNRRNSELYAARSDQGLVLERGHKRSRCCSNHGRNHADGFAKTDHGTVRTTAVAEGPWLASDRRNGGCSSWHVRDVGKLIGPPIDPEFSEERPQPGMSSWSNDRPYHYRDDWTRR